MKHLDSPFAQQNPQEIAWLQVQIKGAKSILEVGSCYGHSLRHLAAAAAPGAIIRSIDLGYGSHSLKGVDTGAVLKSTIDDLKAQGFDAEYLFADSSTPQAVEWAGKCTPYDLVFIDGEHDFPGVRRDWVNYGPMGRRVAFHDIVHARHDVKHLWAEIKTGHRTEESVHSHMGIGIVWMPL